ncbi:MAG: FecR family protein [Treponema sp.]|nr:FecR family protein [Treponema sp.]
MKKTIMTIIFLAVQFVCAALVFGQNGVIKELSGTVELKRAGQTAFVPTKAGDTVAKDTIVSTGFKSTALITVGSTVLMVRPLTRLSLAEISEAAGTETLNVSLQAGRVRVDVNPPAGTKAVTTVRGPSATASVRGTSFEFDTRNLTVHEGVVAFRGSRGAVMMVAAGSTSQLTEDNKAEDSIVKNAAELLPPIPQGADSGFSSVGSGISGAGEVHISIEY